MKLSEFESQITDAYKKYFPNSRIFVQYSDKLGATITIGCYLAGDKTENSGNYWDNDIFSIAFSIHGESGQQLPKGLTADSELPTLELTKYRAHYFITPENKNLCYESRSLSFRKTQGESGKIIDTLNKFFSKLHESITADYKNGRIHPNHFALVGKKLGL